MLNSGKCKHNWSWRYKIKLRISKQNTGVEIIFCQTVTVFRMMKRKFQRRAAKVGEPGEERGMGQMRAKGLRFPLQVQMRRKSAGHGVTPILSTNFDS